MENSSLGGLQFGIDENGNYGYIKAGADSVTPFKTSTPYAFLSYYNYSNTPNRTKLNVMAYSGFECDSNILTVKEDGTYKILCPQMYFRGLYVWINDNITFSCGDLGSIDESVTLNEGDKIYISVDDSGFNHTNKCGLIVKV